MISATTSPNAANMRVIQSATHRGWRHPSSGVARRRGDAAATLALHFRCDLVVVDSAG
jgi:hypothetical protein